MLSTHVSAAFQGIGTGAMIALETEFWFAMQVVPQHEKKVAVLLEHKGYRQFLPTYKASRKWSDRVKLIDLPLFPGYVFCRTQRSLIGRALGTPSIYRVVSFGGRPYPVPEEEITALQQVVHSQRDVCSVPYLAVGRRVEVKTGPLTGVRGFIAQIKNRIRLIISVDLISRSVSVDVHASEVSILSEPATGAAVDSRRSRQQVEINHVSASFAETAMAAVEGPSDQRHPN
jgi:transcription antitermination factor NusG